jgi:hypothetical protein
MLTGGGGYHASGGSGHREQLQVDTDKPMFANRMESNPMMRTFQGERVMAGPSEQGFGDRQAGAGQEQPWERNQGPPEQDSQNEQKRGSKNYLSSRRIQPTSGNTLGSQPVLQTRPLASGGQSPISKPVTAFAHPSSEHHLHPDSSPRAQPNFFTAPGRPAEPRLPAYLNKSTRRSNNFLPDFIDPQAFSSTPRNQPPADPGHRNHTREEPLPPAYLGTSWTQGHSGHHAPPQGYEPLQTHYLQNDVLTVEVDFNSIRNQDPQEAYAYHQAPAPEPTYQPSPVHTSYYSSQPVAYHAPAQSRHAAPYEINPQPQYDFALYQPAPARSPATYQPQPALYYQPADRHPQPHPYQASTASHWNGAPEPLRTNFQNIYRAQEEAPKRTVSIDKSRYMQDTGNPGLAGSFLYNPEGVQQPGPRQQLQGSSIYDQRHVENPYELSKESLGKSTRHVRNEPLKKSYTQEVEISSKLANRVEADPGQPRKLAAETRPMEQLNPNYQTNQRGTGDGKVVKVTRYSFNTDGTRNILSEESFGNHNFPQIVSPSLPKMDSEGSKTTFETPSESFTAEVFNKPVTRASYSIPLDLQTSLQK